MYCSLQISVGKSEADQAMVDMMLSYYMDMLTAVGTVGYDPDYVSISLLTMTTQTRLYNHRRK